MRINSPFEEWAEAWIEVPDVWKGRHAQRYSEAMSKAREAGMSGAVSDFSAHLALLENWSLPGLNGPPDKWDVQELPLKLIAWVNGTVSPLFLSNFIIPKASLPLLPPEMGQADTELSATMP